MEKKTNRVVGVDNGMDLMMDAVNLLGSASRLYSHVHLRWTELSEKERKLMISDNTGAPVKLAEEMKNVNMHKDYCADITDAARDELETLMKKKQAMDAQMRTIIEEKQRRDEVAKRTAETGRVENEDKNAELEEQAMLLMDAGRDIALGRDLGNTNWSVDKKAPVQRPPREPKEPREPRPPKQRLDENGEPIVRQPRPKKLSKKEKKKMKKAAKK